MQILQKVNVKKPYLRVHFNPHTPDEAIICSVDAAIQLT